MTNHYRSRPVSEQARISRLFVAAAILLTVFVAAPSRAGAEVFRADGTEDEILKKVGVDENPGGRLPLDAVFLDQDGSEVRLGGYVDGMPAVLVLNFFHCPMLCPVTFRKLTDTMNRMGTLGLGRDYRVIALSFDPGDTPALAKEKAAEVYGMLEGPGAGGSSFPFLTGGPESIDRVTTAAGYRYVKVDEGYAHPSVIVIITPDGRISRYLYGIEHDPRDLKLALIEASGGKVGGGGVVNRALLYCYQYDPSKGSYSLVAVNAMKLAGVVTLVVVGGLLLALWIKERVRGGAS